MARSEDWADREARRLFEMVQDCREDEEVVVAIAASLRRVLFDADDLSEATTTGELGPKIEW